MRRNKDETKAANDQWKEGGDKVGDDVQMFYVLKNRIK